MRKRPAILLFFHFVSELNWCYLINFDTPCVFKILSCHGIQELSAAVRWLVFLYMLVAMLNIGFIFECRLVLRDQLFWKNFTFNLYDLLDRPIGFEKWCIHDWTVRTNPTPSSHLVDPHTGVFLTARITKVVKLPNLYFLNFTGASGGSLIRFWCRKFNGGNWTAFSLPIYEV